MATVDLPDVLPVEDVETECHEDGLDNPWQAVLYNCDCHTYELAWIVDHPGRVSVYFGEKAECKRVVRILRDIGLRAEVEKT